MPVEVESFTSWLGQTISVGSKVVYPSLSGRSCQLATGEVLKLAARSVEEARNEFGAKRVWDPPPIPGERKIPRTVEVPRNEWEHKIGEPVGVQIRPSGHSSRWERGWMAKDVEGQMRPINLSANATSLVLVPEEEEEES